MAMPYGCLDSQKLSRVSRIGLEKALDWWQKSMQSSKHKTYFVVAGYDDDGTKEIQLRKEMITGGLADTTLLNHIVEISARNEEGLARKLGRVRELLPIESLTVFAESRNAVSIRPIFKRKFGKTLLIRKFKAEFEFDHRWISTSTAFAWFARNWLLRVWFGLKRRLGRRLRKKLRFWFRS
jgi:hypothetical protein